MEELDKNGYVKMFTQVCDEVSKNKNPLTNKIINRDAFDVTMSREDGVFSNEQANLSEIRFKVWRKIFHRIFEYS